MGKFRCTNLLGNRMILRAACKLIEVWQIYIQSMDHNRGFRRSQALLRGHSSKSHEHEALPPESTGWARSTLSWSSLACSKPC